ncbi:hypothetical protein P9850_12195 [Anoxybacillus rupiensis]|uniref:Uncharacterized protein n=1 Tax=Anoxybacteroides rupiense TaxID=311460 RepID=A0ABD5IW69_9BACL|nr:hypothetical protein [Anoxybacillus rupiensis]
MRKMMSFSFRKGQIEKYREVVPKSGYLRSRLLRKFILEEYSLPEPSEYIKVFKDVKNEDTEIYPFHMNEKVLNRIHELANEVKQRAGVTVSSSAIMRDVMDRVIEKYQDANVRERNWKRIVVYVSDEAREFLHEHIDERQIVYCFEDFLDKKYTGPNAPVKELKQRVSNPVPLTLTIDQRIYDDLKEMAEEQGQKVKTSHILRNAINQMIEDIKKGGVYMGQKIVYPTMEEKIIVPDHEREVEYKTKKMKINFDISYCNFYKKSCKIREER